jgi:hypothetical protein
MVVTSACVSVCCETKILRINMPLCANQDDACQTQLAAAANHKQQQQPQMVTPATKKDATSNKYGKEHPANTSCTRVYLWCKGLTAPWAKQ